MRPLPYTSGKRAMLCVMAQWKMSVCVRGWEWEENCMLKRQLSSEKWTANGTVLLGIWKALRATRAFVGRGMETVRFFSVAG